MNVIFDYQATQYQSHGGVSRYVCELRKNIALNGITVHHNLGFYCCQNSILKTDTISTNISSLYFPYRLPKRHLINRTIWETLVHSKLLPKSDIFHQTYYNNVSAPAGSIRVLMVHDFIDEMFRAKQMEQDIAVKRKAIDRADLILCNSESTFRDLSHFHPDKLNKAIVTHLGGFIEVPAPSPVEVNRPYILYIGNRYSYKNFTILKNVYESSKAINQEFDIICVGGEPASKNDTPTAGKINFLNCSDSQLQYLFSKASAFIVTSRYEGFGIPIIEALSLGCKVLATRGGSIPEIGGSYVSYFDPDSEESLSHNLESILQAKTTPQQAESMRIHASTFTWRKCATETLRAYNIAIS